MILPTWVGNLPLVFCVMTKVAWQLKTKSAFWKTLSLTFLLKTFKLGTARCVVELVDASRLVLLALGDVIDHYLLLSSWLSEQHKVMTFVSLEVWLLHTHRLERKVCCLSEFRPSFCRPKDIRWASHSSLVYSRKWTFWGAWWLSYWTLLLTRWRQSCKQLKPRSESGTSYRTDRTIGL